MKSTSIIECAAEDGLILTVSPDGKIKVNGDQNKINEWIETIRENKAAILAELEATAVQQMFNDRSASDPSREYTVAATNTSTDPVLITVSISGLATFDMSIPRARYDGIALLELMDNHRTEHTPARMAA
jgi:hypothetical protein